MPATSTKNEPEYYLIHNIGIDDAHIFRDHEDFLKFESYLKGYIGPIENESSSKQVFTINGKSFYGKPHQPKNYYKRIELLAYSLNSKKFNLLLKENEKKSIEKLIRSLCTRYSMYFNKKYKRSGPVFQGPYKSEILKDSKKILESSIAINKPETQYSSYKHYKDKTSDAWINTKDIQNQFPDYVNLLIDKNNQVQLERINLTSTSNNQLAAELAETLPTIKRFPEIITIVIILILLITVGINNINRSSEILAMQSSTPLSTPSVILATNTPSPTVLSASTDNSNVKKKTLIVNLDNKSTPVPVYKNINQNSQIIFYAVDSDIFEFTSFNSGMYKIKLSETESGYISEKYIIVFNK